MRHRDHPGATGTDNVYTLIDCVAEVVTCILLYIMVLFTARAVCGYFSSFFSSASCCSCRASSGLIASAVSSCGYVIGDTRCTGSCRNGSTIIVTCRFAGGSRCPTGFLSTLCIGICRGDSPVCRALPTRNTTSVAFGGALTPNRATRVGTVCGLSDGSHSVGIRVRGGRSRTSNSCVSRCLAVDNTVGWDGGEVAILLPFPGCGVWLLLASWRGV